MEALISDFVHSIVGIHIQGQKCSVNCSVEVPLVEQLVALLQLSKRIYFL